jgi:hypothetical protein
VWRPVFRILAVAVVVGDRLVLVVEFVRGAEDGGRLGRLVSEDFEDVGDIGKEFSALTPAFFIGPCLRSRTRDR